MREQRGDLWDRFGKSFVVVPTNLGWKPGVAGPGPNVMGVGVAEEAAKRVPGLAALYGKFCARFGAETPVTFDLSTGLVLFPTKPLGRSPEISWRGKATLDLIRRSARQLAAMAWMTRETIRTAHDSAPAPVELEDDDVYVPLVGCGAGGLDPEQVVPVLDSCLADDRFVLVRYRPF